MQAYAIPVQETRRIAPFCRSEPAAAIHSRPPFTANQGRAPWDDAFLAGIAILGNQVRVHKRQTIVCEDETADRCFEIVRGVVRAYKLLPDGRRQIVDFMFPGEVFGLTTDKTYGYSADAVTDTTVRAFATTTLEHLAEERPVLAQSLRDAAYRELRAAQAHILLLGRKTAFERVASFLLSLSERGAKAARAEDAVWVPMSQADIADYLGLTTETVNRVMSQLRDSGMISAPSRGLIHLDQPQQLEEIACAA